MSNAEAKVLLYRQVWNPTQRVGSGRQPIWKALDRFADLRKALGPQVELLWAVISPEEFDDFSSLIADLKKAHPGLVILVKGQGLSLSQIEHLINHQLVFRYLLSDSQIGEHIESGLAEVASRRKQLDDLRTLKQQNEALESIRANLEKMVEQRTQREFNANLEAEKTLKEIQSLLNFVKNVSKCRSLEDLLLEVSGDVRKNEAMLPPLLLLRRNESHHQAFYFQSRQLVERTIPMHDTQALFKKTPESSEVRAVLTNLLGRPIGPLVLQEVQFASSELLATRALFAFEYGISLSSKPRLDLMEAQKWSVVTLALESLLLKDNVRFIARQWADTFNQMVDPILILDRHFTIRSDNKNLASQKVGLCYQVLAGRDRPCLNCPLQETLTQDLPQVRDVSFAGKIYQVHSFPIHLDSGEKVNHVVHQYVDVTNLKDLRGQVIQGEKMAAIGLLAGNIAHELNNPLTGIRSMSELLLLDLDPSSNTAKDLVEVRDAAVRCQNLIGDLLEFSSLGGDAKVGRTDLNEVVTKTVPLLKVAMRSVNTDIQTCDHPVYVRVNPQLLQQVVFNLINNACQAMENGGDLLVQVSEDNGQGIVRVRDTGQGIREEMQEKIFEPFFTTKVDGKGTGLGLSLARSIVERFGGSLSLNVEYSAGSEFIIRLPRFES